MIPPKEEIPEFKEYGDDDEIAITIPENEDGTDVNGSFINQQPAYDNIITAEVQLPIGDCISLGKVNQISVAPDVTTTGEYINEPFMNSIVYEVEFPDNQVREYSSRIIAQNMITLVVYLSYHVLRYYVGRVLPDLIVWELYFIYYRVHEGVINVFSCCCVIRCYQYLF